jgi:hypothetical protein
MNTPGKAAQGAGQHKSKAAGGWRDQDTGAVREPTVAHVITIVEVPRG